jgi:hypothetical protein
MENGLVDHNDLELMDLWYTDGTGSSEGLHRVPRVGEFLWLSGSAEDESCPEKVVRIVRVIHDLRRRPKILLVVEFVSLNPSWDWPVSADAI